MRGPYSGLFPIGGVLVQFSSFRGLFQSLADRLASPPGLPYDMRYTIYEIHIYRYEPYHRIYSTYRTVDGLSVLSSI